MTDAPHGRDERFFATVLPALKAAGYTEYGSQQRLADDTGMNPGTVSRLMRAKTIPDIQFFPALAKASGIPVLRLLVLAEHLPAEALESQETLSETNQSQVGSELTPEEAADRLGFLDDVRRGIFVGFVNSLKDTQNDDEGLAGDDSGGATAQM